MPANKGFGQMKTVTDGKIQGGGQGEIATKRKISSSTVDYQLTMAGKEGLIGKVRQQLGSSGKPDETTAKSEIGRFATRCEASSSFAQTV